MKNWLDKKSDVPRKHVGGRCFHCGRPCGTDRCVGDNARTCFIDVEVGNHTTVRCDPVSGRLLGRVGWNPSQWGLAHH